MKRLAALLLLAAALAELQTDEDGQTGAGGSAGTGAPGQPGAGTGPTGQGDQNTGDQTDADQGTDVVQMTCRALVDDYKAKCEEDYACKNHADECGEDECGKNPCLKVYFQKAQCGALLDACIKSKDLRCYDGGKYDFALLPGSKDKWSHNRMTEAPTLTKCKDQKGCCVTATSFANILVPKCMDKMSCKKITSPENSHCANGDFGPEESLPGKSGSKIAVQKYCRCSIDGSGCNALPILKCWQGGEFKVTKDPKTKLDTWTSVEVAPKLELCHPDEAHCCLMMTSLADVVKPSCGSKDTCESIASELDACAKKPSKKINLVFTTSEFDMGPIRHRVVTYGIQQCRCAGDGCNYVNPCEDLVDASSKANCKKTGEKCKEKADECKKADEKCKENADECKKTDEKCKEKAKECKETGEKCKEKTEECKKTGDEKCKENADKCKKTLENCKKNADHCQAEEDKCMQNADECQAEECGKAPCAMVGFQKKACRAKLDACLKSKSLQCFAGGSYRFALRSDTENTWTHARMTEAPTLTVCEDQMGCCVTATSFANVHVPKCMDKMGCEKITSPDNSLCADGDFGSLETLPDKNGSSITVQKYCRCSKDENGCNAVPILKCWQGGKFTVGKDPKTQLDTWTGVEEEPELGLCRHTEAHCCTKRTSLAGVVKPMCGPKTECDSIATEANACAQKPSDKNWSFTSIHSRIMDCEGNSLNEDGTPCVDGDLDRREEKTYFNKKCRCAGDGCNYVSPCKDVVDAAKAACEAEDDECEAELDECGAELCRRAPCAMVGFREAECRARLDACRQGKILKCWQGPLGTVGAAPTPRSYAVKRGEKSKAKGTTTTTPKNDVKMTVTGAATTEPTLTACPAGRRHCCLVAASLTDVVVHLGCSDAEGCKAAEPVGRHRCRWRGPGALHGDLHSHIVGGTPCPYRLGKAETKREAGPKNETKPKAVTKPKPETVPESEPKDEKTACAESSEKVYWEAVCPCTSDGCNDFRRLNGEDLRSEEDFQTCAALKAGGSMLAMSLLLAQVLGGRL